MYIDTCIRGKESINETRNTPVIEPYLADLFSVTFSLYRRNGLKPMHTHTHTYIHFINMNTLVEKCTHIMWSFEMHTHCFNYHTLQTTLF